MKLVISMFISYYESPLGVLKIVSDDNYLLEVSLVQEKCIKENKNIIVEKCLNQLDEYFEGKRKTFDIEYKLIGTKFQKQVWSELSKVPYGTKISYKDLAIKINNPKAVRAVGTAVGKNKILIIIPCHRVLNSGTGLGGFSAGGLVNKKKLLKLEDML